jgi:hypothetical protein
VPYGQSKKTAFHKFSNLDGGSDVFQVGNHSNITCNINMALAVFTLYKSIGYRTRPTPHPLTQQSRQSQP